MGIINAMTHSSARVTRPASGIGLQIARRLAAAGLTVSVGARDSGQAQRAAAEIGDDARLLRMDVTDSASIAELPRAFRITTSCQQRRAARVDRPRLAAASTPFPCRDS